LPRAFHYSQTPPLFLVMLQRGDLAALARFWGSFSFLPNEPLFPPTPTPIMGVGLEHDFWVRRPLPENPLLDRTRVPFFFTFFPLRETPLFKALSRIPQFLFLRLSVGSEECREFPMRSAPSVLACTSFPIALLSLAVVQAPPPVDSSFSPTSRPALSISRVTAATLGDRGGSTLLSPVLPSHHSPSWKALFA